MPPDLASTGRSPGGRGGSTGDSALREAAVAGFADGHRYEQARARLRLAAALLAVGRRDEAASALRSATRTAEALGAAPLTDAVRRQAARAQIGLTAAAHPGSPASGPTAPFDLGGLTPRELAVLREVALGRTNRQAGEVLSISEKTVSVHLSRAMAKLGVSSRAEAVAARFERGLLAPRADPPSSEPPDA